MDFELIQNKRTDKTSTMTTQVIINKEKFVTDKVVVIGGYTGSDCVGTSNRHKEQNQ
jgi:NADPH-dependent glutamate synthase beta subunit-like oxidoreductase